LFVRRAGGPVSVVARKGAGGPGPNLGPGVNFAVFFDTVINGAGDVAFVSFLSGSGVTTANDVGLFTSIGGTLTAVAREGASGPGPNIAPGVNFAAFETPAMNANGAIAFGATLSGAGVNVSNNRAIFTNAGGTLQMIARTGDAFDVNPGAGVDLRTISAIGTLYASGGEDGRGRSFSDAGLLTFRLAFSDGSSGVFTAFVPEPAAAGILLSPLAGLLLARRRRRAV
jgi:hypothetical protein